MSQKRFSGFLNQLSGIVQKNGQIDPDLYQQYGVKRGLRNINGTGVLVGLTEVGEVQGYTIEGEQKIPIHGRLKYRGIDIEEIVQGMLEEKRPGFEEVCYLLLFGELPNAENLQVFMEMLGQYRSLPAGFTRDMILKAPSNNIMNKLARSVLAFYTYDDNPDDTGITNVLRQSIELIARFPTMAAHGYHAMSYYHKNNSLYIHKPDPKLGTAENLLLMLRADGKYTATESQILDLSLVLHAEHGGGNNSAFSVRAVSSSGTDTYSAIASALGSLKGPRHGGANLKVLEMMEDIKNNVSDWTDEDSVARYLEKIVLKETFDRKGLIYGLGHAVYTLSDPRAVLLKRKSVELALEKGRLPEYNLYSLVEKLAPGVIQKLRKPEKIMCVNVDFYSGFVYESLDIPRELCTPLFAISRVAGWCAHRIEELVNNNPLIRPAYKSVLQPQKYIPLAARSSYDDIPRSASEGY